MEAPVHWGVLLIPDPEVKTVGPFLKGTGPGTRPYRCLPSGEDEVGRGGRGTLGGKG